MLLGNMLLLIAIMVFVLTQIPDRAKSKKQVIEFPYDGNFKLIDSPHSCSEISHESDFEYPLDGFKFYYKVF